MARSLIEISAAFGHETNAIATIWKARKAEPAPDLESLCDFDVKARKIVCQILFGTKLKRDKTAESGVERTNILTLIDNACKELQTPGVRRLYDVLCDTVHPSIGSNRCFWTKGPCSEDGPVLPLSQTGARGHLGDLPFAIGKGVLWSLLGLGAAWVAFERTRHDICLTGKMYALPQSYFGLVRPGDPSGFCVCGSQKPEASCIHEFGYDFQAKEPVARVDRQHE